MIDARDATVCFQKTLRQEERFTCPDVSTSNVDTTLQEAQMKTTRKQFITALLGVPLAAKAASVDKRETLWRLAAKRPELFNRPRTATDFMMEHRANMEVAFLYGMDVTAIPTLHGTVYVSSTPEYIKAMQKGK